ncbi:MAG: hypothetical protein KBT15_02660 [Bacteroidales bacterium]|nr:hypothetical protein [Candidatus Minthousia equi]
MSYRINTKVVYVLVSCESDYYCEQLLMSLFSLKYYNPDVDVELITDSKTYQSFVGNRAMIKKDCNRTRVFDLPNELNREQKSRYLKTNLRNLIHGNYLFLDTDTIITGSIAEIDNLRCDVGAVLDSFSLEGKDCF